MATKKRTRKKRPLPKAPPTPANYLEKARHLRELARKVERAATGRVVSHSSIMAQRARDDAADIREVGPLPAMVNPPRKARCRRSLLRFCRGYFPRRFRLKFAEPHRTAIDRLERSIRDGGLFACAMPRGTGKTTIAEVAVLWALLYGFRHFVVLVCATHPLAKRRLKALLKEIETNDRLLEDFPEVCYLIRKLERIHNRTAGQTLGGVPTRIEMTQDGVILPTVKDSAASGAVIQVASMDGAVRGLIVAGPDGEMLRPDLVLLDDVQTRESAKSPIQTTDREQIVSDDILGLAGPDKTIAAAMLCTVIYPNDLSDRYLSPEKHAEWQGVRTKMLESFPTNLEKWDEYAEVLRESFRSGDGGERGNAFYRQYRKELDAGAVVSWPERLKKGECSAIQSAMNLYLRNPRGFRAEYQNEPDVEGGVSAAKEFRADLVSARLSGLPRFEVPREATRLTAMIDVGSGLLWYAVIAWDKDFGGAVVDYGSWPRQARTVFENSDPRPGLKDKYPGMVETQWVYAGLHDLTTEVLGRIYYREKSGEQMRVERCLIDCGWLAQTVYQFCRQSPFGPSLYPSKGIARTTTARGVSEWKPRPGERSGFHWRLTISETGRGQMVQFDPDAWKSSLHERLATAAGGRGCLTFYGRNVGDHELVALHCAAEYATAVTLRGASFDKWEVRPHRPDNHLLDCLVGACVAAGVVGLTWSPSSMPAAPPSKPRQSFREMQLAAKARQGGRR